MNIPRTAQDTAREVASVGHAGRHPSRGSADRALRRFRPAVGWVALATLLVALVGYPLVMLAEEFAAEARQAIDALRVLPGIKDAIINTAVLGVGATPIALVIGTSLALATNRLPHRLRKVAAVLPLVPLVVPVVAFVVGWAFLLSPSVGYINTGLRGTPFFDHLDDGPVDVYSFMWIVILSGIRLSSFVYVFVYSALRTMGPQYEEAAAIHGAGGLRTLFTVKLPLLRPALVTGGSTALLMSLGEFSVPLLLGRGSGIDVITTKMYLLTHQYPANYAAAAALASMLLVFGLLMVVVIRKLLGNQQRFVIAASSLQGRARRSSALSVVWVTLYVLVALVLPILAVVHVSLQPYWSGTLSLSNVTVDGLRTILLDDQRSISAIWMSISSSAIAVAILLPIGFFAALGTLTHVRVPRFVRGLLESVPTIPLAVPHAVFGFGLLLAYTQFPFVLYGTVWLLVVGYVTVTLPYARSTQFAALIGLDRVYWEASKMSGASGLRTLTLVVAPLARPGLVAAAAITFVLLSHEFTVSMMVGTAQTQVLGMLLYDYWTGGTYPQVAALAVVMSAVTFAGVVLAFAVGARRGLTDLNR